MTSRRMPESHWQRVLDTSKGNTTMKRTILVASLTTLFMLPATALADNVVYPTGQMPTDSDLKAVIDKVNFLDDATISHHRKSIGALFEGQARQDAAIANNYKIGNAAATYAAEANENAGIIMNKQADLEATVTANQNRAETQVGLLKGEINTKVDVDVYMRQIKSDMEDRNDIRNQTTQLWEQKASVDNVNELRGAQSKESAERISGYHELKDTKVDVGTYQQQQVVVQQRTAAAQSTADKALDGVSANRVSIDDHTMALSNHENRIRNTEFTQQDQGATLRSHEERIVATSAQVSQNQADIQNLNTAMEEQAAGTQRQFSEVRQQQDKDREEYRAGIASVAAMSNIPTVPGHTFDVGVGLGNFANSTAVAVGAHYRPSENNVFKASMAMSNEGKGAFGLGYSYGF